MIDTLNLINPSSANIKRQIQVHSDVITPKDRLPNPTHRAMICGKCPFKDFTKDGCDNAAFLKYADGKPRINSVQVEYIAAEFLPESQITLIKNHRSLAIALLALCTLPLQNQKHMLNDIFGDRAIDYVK